MTRFYRTPLVSPEWTSAHNVHPAVATAIHAISTTTRNPESIWFDPYPAEVVNVMLAVEEYVCHGDFPLGTDGRFQWNGLEVELDHEKIADALRFMRFCTDSEWPEWMRQNESAELSAHHIRLDMGSLSTTIVFGDA